MAESARRYRLLDDDDRFGLHKGDIVVGLPYRLDPGSRTNPDGKIFILYREDDGHEPGCNLYWYTLKRIGGRIHVEWSEGSNKWAPAPKPRSRKKRWQQHAATSRH